MNYPILIKFDTQVQISIPSIEFDKNLDFSNSRWRTDAILKIVFGSILATYWPINAKFGMDYGDNESRAGMGHVTKNGNSPN